MGRSSSKKDKKIPIMKVVHMIFTLYSKPSNAIHIAGMRNRLKSCCSLKILFFMMFKTSVS